MRDPPCQARISCRLGSRFQRAQDNQSPGNADVVFDVSIRDPPLDRSARRADRTHDFPERPRAHEHVSPMLYGFPGLVALKRRLRFHMSDCGLPGRAARTDARLHTLALEFTLDD